MLTNPLNCPSCNAAIPAMSSETGRIPCPRCGEWLPIGKATPAILETSRLETEVQRHRQARAQRSVKATVIVGVSLGILGIVIGLLWRSLGSKPVVPPRPQPVAPSALLKPMEMPGLGYLPLGTDSVISLQLRAGIATLPETERSDPRKALASLGLPKELVDGVERATGMSLNEVDQLVFGLKLKDGSLAAQPVLIVHAVQKVDFEGLVKKVKGRTSTKGDRTYCRAALSSQLPIEIVWWSPAEKILIAALNESVLNAIPAEGGLELPTRIVNLAETSLAGDPFFWAVLDSEKWEALASFLELVAGKKKGVSVAEVISPLRSLVLGVRVDGEPILNVSLELKSDRSAEELRTYLNERFKKANEDALVGGGGNGVGVRLPLRGEGMGALIQKLR